MSSLAKNKNVTFRRGILLFNRHRFFACHEVWEEIWLEAPPSEKPFYQGLIQVAAAFHHYQRGNLRGTYQLLRRGAEKLGGYPARYHGIDLAGLRAALDRWLGRLGRGRSTDRLRFPRIQRAASPHLRRREIIRVQPRVARPPTSPSSAGGRSRRKPNN